MYGRQLARATFVAFVLGLLPACSTTLSTLQPATPLPKGSVQAGLAQNINVPIGRIVGVIDASADPALRLLRDGEYKPTEDEQAQLLGAAVGLGLNPPGTTPDVMIRYGAFDDVDFGLRYSGTAIHADGKVRLFHSKDGLDGALSLGLSRARYSGLLFDVLDVVGIRDFSRTNLELPFIIGRPMGDYGHIWTGPKVIVSRYEVDATLVRTNVTTNASGFMFYGGAFAGVALGYKYVFGVAELTLMYMKAGANILGREVNLGGVVLMPSVGIMARFPLF
jgi:hypothetical protein